MSLVEGVGLVALGIGGPIGLSVRVIELLGGRPASVPLSAFAGLAAVIAGYHLGWAPLVCTGGLVFLGSTAWAMHRQTGRDEERWVQPWGVRSRSREAPSARHRQG